MEDTNMRVLLLLGQGFEDAEAVCALDVCGWTSYRPALPGVSVEVAALAATVRGRFGTSFAADVLVPDVDCARYGGLVIPGGFRPEFDEVYCEDVYRVIRGFAQAGKPIATMCVGVIPVARAGALKGREATTYAYSRHDNFAMIEECGCRTVRQPVCNGGGIISCSGPAYSEDVMRLFMQELVGPQVAEELDTYRRG